MKTWYLLRNWQFCYSQASMSLELFTQCTYIHTFWTCWTQILGQFILISFFRLHYKRSIGRFIGILTIPSLRIWNWSNFHPSFLFFFTQCSAPLNRILLHSKVQVSGVIETMCAPSQRKKICEITLCLIDDIAAKHT